MRADERGAAHPLGREPCQLELVLRAGGEAHHHRPLGAGRVHHGQAVAGEFRWRVAHAGHGSDRSAHCRGRPSSAPGSGARGRGSASSSGGSAPATRSGAERPSPRPRRRPRRRAAGRRARRSPRCRGNERGSAPALPGVPARRSVAVSSWCRSSSLLPLPVSSLASIRSSEQLGDAPRRVGGAVDLHVAVVDLAPDLLRDRRRDRLRRRVVDSPSGGRRRSARGGGARGGSARSGCAAGSR